MPSDRAATLGRRDVLTLSGLGLSASLAGCTGARRWVRERRLAPPERRVAADWHPDPGQWPLDEYGFARTRHNPYATPPRADPEAAWAADVARDADGDSDRVTALVIGDGTVFVRTRSALTALDAADGSERWRRQRDEGAGLTYVAERLYETGRTWVRALSPGGEEQWTATRDEWFFSLLERDGWVYILGRDTVTRLHADTGDVVGAVDRSVYAPTTIGGPVYAGQYGLSAYDVADGAFRTRWSVDGEYPYDTYAAPTATGGRLYRPERANGGSDGSVGRISIFDASDGSRRTLASFPETPRALAAGGESLYVSTAVVSSEGIGTDGRCVAFSLAGEERWRYEPGASLNPPVVANGAVYLTSFANREVPLVALDAATGEELWRRDLTGASELAAADETLYVAAGGTVRALRA